MKTIKHEELKADSGKKIIIDICQLSEGEFEGIVLYENGDELDCIKLETESKAVEFFENAINTYAGPMQRIIYNAKLVEGEKYTLVYLDDFGFPMATKITFHSIQFCTYAQFSDCVRMVFIPYRKRTAYAKIFYDCSLLIFKGWQDLKDEDTKDIIKENESIRMTRSKYGCFDSRYIDDIEKIFKFPIAIYRNNKIGVNGKIYS